MASLAENLGLGPSDFAFYFETSAGIDAADLGTFLKRAATVARRQGIELRVTGVRPGSVAVIVTAAKKEFGKAPIATTGAALGIVAALVGALIWAMSPEKSGATPLGKSGAEIIENKNVSKIQIITINKTIVVMDRDSAAKIRALQHHEKPARITADMISRARDGSLVGTTVAAGGELLFRPEGYRYFVPVDSDKSPAFPHIFPGAMFMISGEIVTYRGQPDHIIVRSARQI